MPGKRSKLPVGTPRARAPKISRQLEIEEEFIRFLGNCKYANEKPIKPQLSRNLPNPKQLPKFIEVQRLGDFLYFLATDQEIYVRNLKNPIVRHLTSIEQTQKLWVRGWHFHKPFLENSHRAAVEAIEHALK